MSISKDEIDREMDVFEQVPEWGCSCGAEGPHDWYRYSLLRRGFWGMCACKGGEPHLHAISELREKQVLYPFPLGEGG